MRKLSSLALVFFMSMFDIAVAQDRCFQAGQTECKQAGPGQPYIEYLCEDYGGSRGLRQTYTGKPCVTDLRGKITGTWKLTLDCPDGKGDLTWRFQATSAASFSARETSGTSTFDGTITGNDIAWKEHLPQHCTVISGVKECTPAWDRTYKLKLSGSRLIGTMLFVELGGPDPRRHTCNIRGTKM